MFNNVRIAEGEKDDHKVVNFFGYKRDVENTITQFRENGGFADQEEMKNFIYNQQQSKPDGIIMEVNTANVGWPGMIEVIDGADIAYIKSFPESPYSKFIKELDTLAVYANNPKYFEEYILAELKNKNAERMLILFHKQEYTNFGPEDIGLKKEYADCISLQNLKKMIKENQTQLEKTLLMNYGFTQGYRPEKNFKVFKEIFKDRYLNEENSVFSSKLRPSVLWREDLTGSYISKEDITTREGNDIHKNPTAAKALETSYLVKELFIDQGKWIHFPWEWSFTDDNKIKIKNMQNAIIRNYILQRFHELPRKITLENWGLIVAKTVDIRAFVTFDVEKRDVDIQLFWREWNIWKVANVSSGGKFTKTYTVPDERYYDMQSKINSLVTSLWSKENNAIEKYFDDYSRNNLKILPEGRISHIPFIISKTGTKRIVDLVRKLVNNMIEIWFISKNDEDQIVGNTVIGIDISINPLPKENI